MRSMHWLIALGVTVGCGDNRAPQQPDAALPDASAVCVDGEHALYIEQTGEVSFDRSYAWAIDLTASAGSLVLAEGQVFDVRYTAQLTRTWSDQWRAAGGIAIANPAPFAATVTGVILRFGEVDIPIDCGVAFPHELAAGARLACTANLADLAAAPARVLAEVTTSGCVMGASAAAPVDPSKAVMRETDECISVYIPISGESFAGTEELGSSCAEITYEWTSAFGPYCCGTSGELLDTLAFETNDTNATGSDSTLVTWSVPTCWIGCTLTVGYWKTHASYGPAYFDSAWLELGPLGADTPFFTSGKTYYEQLSTEPEGNAYVILAHAYIGAKLNALNETAWGVVETALARAEAIFADGAEREEMLELASYLDAYNNGLIGPGHCSE